MNVEMLLKIKAHILEEPKRVNMDVFRIRKNDMECATQPNDLLEKHVDSWPACGTVGCIAAWALMLDGMEEWWRCSPADWAARLLDLTNRRLFFVEHWPTHLVLKLDRCKGGTRAYANVVALAIDDFIATDGWIKEAAS